MSKTVKIIVIAVVVIGIGLLIITKTGNESANRITDTATSSQSTNSNTADIPTNWERYEDTTYNFSLAHPTEATVQAEGIDEQNHIKFMYLGSPQATGHINDGFTLTVSTYWKSDMDAGSLEAFVDSRIEEQQQAADVIQEPSEATFNNRPAFEYQIESIGTIDVTAVETDDAFVTISHNITDPNDSGYEEMIADMKNSLVFTDRSEN